MRVTQIENADKRKYMRLLLLADESEEMIERYLGRGRMYVLDDGGVRAECVVTDEGNGVAEIKNIAVLPEYRRMGYGKALIGFIARKYADEYTVLTVGTGDVPSATAFYESCGFLYSGRIENFFMDNYSHEMYENGIRLVDMIYMSRSLRKESETSIIKRNLIEYYNAEAPVRNAKTVKSDWKLHVRSMFRDIIKKENKRTLLELGAGSGYDSLFFKENGFEVTAVDISPEMVKCCRDKGIDAVVLDYYDLPSFGRRFDCVYAINTLLHVPKRDLSQVVGGIASVMNSDGLFYLGLYAGDDREEDSVIAEISDAPRRFVFYSEGFLKNVLKKEFEILSFDTLSVGDGERNDMFHSVILRKKP